MTAWIAGVGTSVAVAAGMWSGVDRFDNGHILCAVAFVGIACGVAVHAVQQRILGGAR